LSEKYNLHIILTNEASFKERILKHRSNYLTTDLQIGCHLKKILGEERRSVNVPAVSRKNCEQTTPSQINVGHALILGSFGHLAQICMWDFSVTVPLLNV